MEILSLESKEFKKYGKVIEGYDFTELLDVLRKETEKPDDHVIYFPGNDALEATAVAKEIETNIYGGMPIQIGFCNGTNSKLNCLEYHRDTEINIADDDMVLMLATMSDLEDDYTMDADKIELLITEKTVAIVPVHVYGNLCDVEKIDAIAKKHHLKVIYDAAHAFAVKYKGISSANFGDASMFSFHATKVFNTIEGGAVCFQQGRHGGDAQ